jgi:hypothetical protein
MPKRGHALGKRDKPVKRHSRDRRERDFRPQLLANAAANRAPVLAHAEKLWARKPIGVKHISIGFSDRPKGAAF